MNMRLLLGTIAAVTMLPTMAHGVTLRTNLQTGGYGQVALAKNDDQSSILLDMPFEINFYGNKYSSLYVNNNGNVTFGSPLGDFTPYQFDSLNQAMIAPFWADVDTRCAGCGDVFIGSFADNQLTVTWNDVGYFSQHDDKLNNFQMTLFGNAGGVQGDFDIEFRYDRLEWTTGDASEGTNGLGGIPAAAGYTTGNADGQGTSYLQPGSLSSPGALAMADRGNTQEDTPGLWVYNIRNAETPQPTGLSPEFPFLPDEGSEPGDYVFNFNVGDTTTRYFIDPPVATGYDYSVAGNTFTSALFTSALDDTDGYQLYSGGMLLGTAFINQVFNFDPMNPISSFSLRGINPQNMLDPNDPTVFVSGFTFGNTGNTSVRQTSFAENFQAPVPEPASWAMMIVGFGMVGFGLRSRRKAAVTTKVSFA